MQDLIFSDGVGCGSDNDSNVDLGETRCCVISFRPYKQHGPTGGIGFERAQTTGVDDPSAGPIPQQVREREGD